jgi:anhydro-N-acetylmuramic acid kinase
MRQEGFGRKPMQLAHVIGRLAAKRRLRVAGLMSGTSADGVSVAIVDLGPGGVKVLTFGTFPYPLALRQAVLDLSQPKSGRVDDVCHLNFVLGEVFASALIKLARRAGVPLDSIDLVGSHGQTIQHIPQGRVFGRRRVRSTLQIAEPAVIAERTAITTVADFRPRDVAAGGEGAPLVPYADFLLFGGSPVSRAVQNIGGIANVTYLPAGGDLSDTLAFDTGPGNMVIDSVVSRATSGRLRYDRDGKLAARGKVEPGLLAELMRHPFLRRRPPKSTGREEFGSQFAEAVYRRARGRGVSPLDILATVTAFTTRSIAQAYGCYLPRGVEEVLLCGGGARNRTLVRMLSAELEPARVRMTDEFGVPVEAKEAVSFALLAVATIRGEPGNVPRATGARRPVVLGKIVPAC